MAGDLETVDFHGVDVLARGGPYFGQGSPPEGDFYTDADLEEIAANTRRLMEGGELHAPIKLGHGIDQKLAKESGYSDGEMPALGWLENPRVEGGKLLTDWMGVPKKLADLIKAKAFRTRSVELRSYVSQKTGDRVGPAIKGLALQGAKSPAVRTLDDVIALYSDEVEEDVQIREYGEVVWNPDLGYRWVQASIASALNPQDSEIRYYVADVGPETALITSFADTGNTSVTTTWPGSGSIGGTWIVPFTITDDKTTVAPADEWISAQERWLERAREFAEQSDPLSRARADTTRRMAGNPFTEDQARELAESLGLETEDIDFEAVKSKVAELKALEESADPGDEDGVEKITVPKDEWERVLAAAAKAEAAETKLSEMERDRFLTEAIEDGKIVPADLDDWTRRYDEHPEVIREVVTALRPHQEFLREYGSDNDGRGLEGEYERKLGDAFEDYLGIPEEDRVAGRST